MGGRQADGCGVDGAVKAVLPASARLALEQRLPAALTVRWFSKPEEALQEVVDADIAWLDFHNAELVASGVEAAGQLKWLFTVAAGVESIDLARLREKGVILTDGAGVNAAVVADYAVMGILIAAKRYDEVVRLADRHQWTQTAPGRTELEGSHALIVGQGAIGSRIAARLQPFGVAVTGVTRSGRSGTLSADAWRRRLGEFDWVVLAAPATEETHALMGAAEFAAMRPSAWLVNIARGDLVDQAALIDALREGRIGGAFLDTVSPEPLPADHPLWSAPNCLITMHLAGRSQSRLVERGAALFLENLDAFLNGKPMRNVVDLDSGY
jgi:phosphoglycerate dehydrogenase-like enzyme